MRARGSEIPSPETLAKVFRAPLSEVKAKLELAGESSNRAWSHITRTFLSDSTERFLDICSIKYPYLRSLQFVFLVCLERGRKQNM